MAVERINDELFIAAVYTRSPQFGRNAVTLRVVDTPAVDSFKRQIAATLRNLNWIAPVGLDLPNLCAATSI